MSARPGRQPTARQLGLNARTLGIDPRTIREHGAPYVVGVGDAKVVVPRGAVSRVVELGAEAFGRRVLAELGRLGRDGGCAGGAGYPAVMAALVFFSPDVETELGIEDVPVVMAELSVLVRPDWWFDAAGAVARLETARSSGVVVDLREWERPELAAFARALDHIRNAEPASDIPEPRPLSLLRDRVIAYAGLEQRTYDFTVTPDLDVRQFFSYTGPYDVGDRLVAPHDHGLRLVVVERQPGDPNEHLTCQNDGA